jgi:hypothetical protein
MHVYNIIPQPSRQPTEDMTDKPADKPVLLVYNRYAHAIKPIGHRDEKHKYYNTTLPVADINVVHNNNNNNNTTTNNSLLDLCVLVNVPSRICKSLCRTFVSRSN